MLQYSMVGNYMAQQHNRVIGVIVAVLMAVISGLFIFNVMQSGYFPTNYLVVLAGIIILLNILIDWLIISRGRIWKKVLASFLVLLVSFGFVAGASILGSIGKTVDEVVKPIDESDVYSVLVRTDDPLQKASEVQGLPVGAAEDADFSVIIKLLPNNAGAKLQTYISHPELVQALLNKSEQLIFFNEAFRPLVEEIIPDFQLKTRILAVTDPSIISLLTPPNTSGITTETVPVMTNPSNPTSSNASQVTTQIPAETLPPVEVSPPVRETVATFPARSANGSDPFLLYISGTDSSGGINSRGRSDVNIVAAINPSTHQIALITIPRDSYVALAGIGYKDKLTHAGVLGINTSQKTVENILGRGIDAYAKVNFTTLVRLVDNLGGITVYNPTAFGPFAAGNIRLNGSQALAFSRERKSLSGGDLARGMNQTRVIQGIINEAVHPGNLARVDSILATLSGSFRTSLSSSAIQTLVRGQLSSGGGWNIQSYGMTGSGRSGLPSYMMPGYRLSFIVLNQSSISRAKDLISSVVGY